MNKKMSKRQRDIKSKLMAAICMLLVSSIMMVSTTYAWFTLSTAPEVTGITTAVGANGNLEMALLPSEIDLTKLDDPTNGIKSAAGDSMEAANQLLKDANITWGNLVDLKDPSYGLDMISLYPAALAYATTGEGEGATTDTTKLNALSFLERPVYGADGRVSELTADTISASYISGGFSKENAYGVRAVGTSSSMTARELSHRALLAQASSLSSSAKTTASNSLNTNGNVLAGIAVKHANGDDSNYSYNEVNTIKTVVSALKTALGEAESAVKNYIAANNVALSANETNYEEVKSAILGMELTAIDSSNYVHPDNLGEMATKLSDATTNVTSAETALTTTLTGKTETDKFAWSDFSAQLNLIMNTEYMTLCEVKINELKTDAGVNAVLKNMGKGIILEMGNGSGAYETIADFCGDYTAMITLPTGTSVTFGTITADLGGMEATMKTKTDVSPSHLDTMAASKASFEAGTNASAEKNITEFYGYIIDLAFRTNVANSYLQLQTEAENRIYESNTENDAVMGHGSTMTFKSASNDFPQTSVRALMKSIRIVFFEPDTKTILSEARLDVDNATADADGSVTAKMYLWDGTAFNTATPNIVELTQNTAKAVSALVYLDGNSVSNKDVAATGSQSMTGKMNLQFSSSANLTPMDYSDLKKGEGTTGAAATTIALTGVTVDTATANQNIGVLEAYSATYAGNKGIGVVLTGKLPENAVVKATIAGTDYEGTAMTVGGMSGYVFNYSGITEDTADTEITISVTAGTSTENDAGGDNTDNGSGDGTT